ncbi:glycoside hydrolase family 76 protein [Pleomassaria siparia CBS 279.74]|uniref:Mannan endo-1,6-alpha-mannosidase n=1 Tax=Pleomassaria siparia CBS 279.74 TaxID=1314801 RepID=A0A6G1KKT3_9PLEO|nr:glycoside hydrolase family 76 protein [Pleomassaria siparia CBS 279.74]
MFASKLIFSLVVPFVLNNGVGAIDLDTSKPDTIKSTAKTLAGAIVKAYTAQLDGNPIGVFPDPIYWWESGATWGSLVEYSHLTGDSQFDDVVAKALYAQLGEYDAFMPQNQTKALGNDDQSTWALAAMSAAESAFKKPEDGQWIDFAKNVFDIQTLRWDNSTCDGGLRWQIFSFNNGYNYKNSFTNANLFLLSARLAQFTGNKTYSEWADKSFTWMQDIQIISDAYAVFDGTSTTTNCTSISHIQWSYPFAVLAEGAAVMYNLTSDATWKSAVSGLVGHLSVFQDKSTSILYEPACETNGDCDTDQVSYKGLAARSLARAALSAPIVAEDIRKVLEVSAVGAAKSCSGGDDVKCSIKWTTAQNGTSGKSVEDGGLSETLSALLGVQALLFKDSQGSITTNETSQTVPGSPSASGSPTGSATGAAQATGAAGKAELAWGTLAFAALLSVLA